MADDGISVFKAKSQTGKLFRVSFDYLSRHNLVLTRIYEWSRGKHLDENELLLAMARLIEWIVDVSWFNFLSDSDIERCIEIGLKRSNLIQFWYDICPTNHSIFAAAFTLNHVKIPLLHNFATPLKMTGLWCAKDIGTLPRKLIKQCPYQIKNQHQQ